MYSVLESINQLAHRLYLGMSCFVFLTPGVSKQRHVQRTGRSASSPL